MKKMFLCLLALPAGLLALGADCSGSNVVECSTDLDCPEDAPTCSEVDGQSICVAAEQLQCEADLACQVTDAGSSAECAASSACPGGEKCVLGADAIGRCVSPSDTCEDVEGFDLEAATATDTEGESVTFCADAAVSCTEDNACAGGTFDS